MGLVRRKVNDIPECNIISLIKLEIVLQIFMNPQYMVDSEEEQGKRAPKMSDMQIHFTLILGCAGPYEFSPTSLTYNFPPVSSLWYPQNRRLRKNN